MLSTKINDLPIDNPDNDLLGMADFAGTLAQFVSKVEPPFTLGIYGDWGEGKTSFVNLLRHELMVGAAATERHEMEFIAFQSWRYSTADELWRALLLKIAQALYGVTPHEELDSATQDETETPGNNQAATDEDGKPKSASLRSKLLAFLKNDALVFHQASLPDPNAEYHIFAARLDRSLAGSISRGTAHQLQVNQEAALTALSQGVVAALGSMSPFVAGIRGLFGIKTEIDLSSVFLKNKNEVTRNTAESKDDFKSLFQELFQKRAKGKRVYIFVDDLDRCMPDVALDLLEAVKVFLGDEKHCVFIIAVNQNVIGQAWRLRYKDLLSADDQSIGQDSLARAGEQYLEKFVQLAVRVPPRTPEQTHSFISAQFPRWMPTTDIIATAIGSNPRRLKQYANLLSLTYLVAQMHKTPASKEQ